MSNAFEFETEEVLLTDKTAIWEVVLHNDDINSFDFVIDVLMNICDHHQQQAEQCALITHLNGKCSVKETSESKSKKISGILNEMGLSSTFGPLEMLYH